MTMTFRNLALSSALGGLLLTVVGGLLSGPEMGLGIFSTAVVMLINLWAWSVVVDWALRAGQVRRKPYLAMGAYGFKAGILGLSLVALLKIFPVVSVVLGSSVVLCAVSVWALHSLFFRAKAGDACG